MKSGKSQRAFTNVSDKLLSVDHFSEPVRLNFNKESKFSTCAGLIMTVLCYCVVGVYAIQRLQVLIYRQEPTIVTNEVLSAYTADELLNLNENGFKLAFGVMDYKTGLDLGDPLKTQWELSLKVRHELKTVEKIKLKFGTSTDEDYADFFPIVDRNAAFLETLKENKVLNCIDRSQILQIRGENNLDAVQINIDFYPCRPTKRKECDEYNYEDFKDYLGHPELVLYQNTQRFDEKVFTSDSIVSESFIWTQHIDKR